MKIATVWAEERMCWGRVEGNDLIDASSLAPNLREYLAAGGDMETLQRHNGMSIDLGSAKFAPPVPNPSKIWCTGLNFEDYRQELGRELPKVPLIFLKAPSTLTGHGSVVGVPNGYGSVFDEWELTAVLGRRLTEATPEQALEAVFGYTILYDLTIHEIELASRAHQQWVHNIDGFAPCGPWVVTADELDISDGLAMRRRVNGEVKAESSSSQMRDGLPELLSFISTFSTLEPGDLVTGGTPPAGPCNAGDELEGEIEGIGTLRVRLVDRNVDPQWRVAFSK